MHNKRTHLKILSNEHLKHCWTQVSEDIFLFCAQRVTLSMLNNLWSTLFQSHLQLIIALNEIEVVASLTLSAIHRGTPLALWVDRNVYEGLCIIWLSMKHICYNLLHLFALVWMWRHPAPSHRPDHYRGQSENAVRGTSCYCVGRLVQVLLDLSQFRPNDRSMLVI